MQTEMVELKQYKEQLAEKVAENKKLVALKAPSVEEVEQFNRLKEEKVNNLVLFLFPLIYFQFSGGLACIQS